MKFYVDERVIVPRSPIGELIRHQFTPWIDIDSIHHMLDLCTGSGCIGIASAYVFKKATVVLSDISDQALEVAKRIYKSMVYKTALKSFYRIYFSSYQIKNLI